jgi:hypothetical protein
MGKKRTTAGRADGVFIVGENGSSGTMNGGAATFRSGAGANGATALVGVFVVTLEAARRRAAETARCLCSVSITWSHIK